MNKILLESEIREWIEDNRENLPLNIDSWKIEIEETQQSEDKEDKLKPLTFGKYNGGRQFIDSFYKSISRIISIKDEI